MSETILITGGSGFIGLNLIDYIIKRTEYNIIVIDNLSSGNFALLKKIVESKGLKLFENSISNKAKVSFFKKDIRDKDIGNIIKNSDYIVHLAAQTGVIPSIENPEKDAEINVFGTLNLLMLAKKHKIKKFVFSSSAAPLGEQIPPLDESKIPSPLSPYGASKLAAEGYCKAFYGSFGLETVILRFSNVYGIYSYHKGSVVAEFFKRIIKGEPLTVYGDGNQTRDFIFAEDLAEIIVKALNSENIGGEIFQLGTGIETSVNSLVKKIKEITGENIKVIYAPPRKGEIIRNYTSIEKAKRILNFNPKHSLKEGIEKTWNWFKENKNAF